MHNKLFDHVFQYQFFQNRPGQAEIRVVPKINYTKEDSSRIISELKLASSNLIDFSLRIVKDIKRTKAGKQPILIQHIPLSLSEKNRRFSQ